MKNVVNSDYRVVSHSVKVTKTARYLTLGSTDPAVDKIWFLLHGYGQLAGRFLHKFTDLDDGKTVLVAPEGLSKFYLQGFDGKVGATWMTREDRESEIADYLDYLDVVYNEVDDKFDLAGKELTLLGFSQGAATVCRWHVLRSPAAHKLILWSGLLPEEFLEPQYLQHFKNVKLVLVEGRRDEFRNDQQVEHQISVLADAGIRYEIVRFDGGHEISPAVLPRLR
jgi:predicted esterase